MPSTSLKWTRTSACLPIILVGLASLTNVQATAQDIPVKAGLWEAYIDARLEVTPALLPYLDRHGIKVPVPVHQKLHMCVNGQVLRQFVDSHKDVPSACSSVKHTDRNGDSLDLVCDPHGNPVEVHVRNTWPDSSNWKIDLSEKTTYRDKALMPIGTTMLTNVTTARFLKENGEGLKLGLKIKIK